MAFSKITTPASPALKPIKKDFKKEDGPAEPEEDEVEEPEEDEPEEIEVPEEEEPEEPEEDDPPSELMEMDGLNRKNASFTFKTPKGEVLRKYTVVNGKMDGPCEEYQDSHLVSRMNFSKGKLHGLMESFDIHQRVEHQLNYEGGLLEGTSKFYQNGQLNMVLDFQKGIQHGPATVFYPSGQKQSEVNYTKGQRDGSYTLYTETGFVMQMMLYKKGLLDGEQVSYFPDTKVVSEKVTYKKGLRHGPMERHSPDGQVIEKMTYVDDSLHGDLAEYNPPAHHGKPASLSREAKYDKGKLLWEKRYDMKGKLVSEFKRLPKEETKGGLNVHSVDF